MDRFTEASTGEMKERPQGTSTLSFYFGEHIVTAVNREQQRVLLESQFRENFEIGRENTFFCEAWDGDSRLQSAFERGLKLHNSFLKAYGYYIAETAVLQKYGVHRSVPEKLINEALDILLREEDEQKAFFVLQLEALDAFRQRGYDIKVVFEQGKKVSPPADESGPWTREKIQKDALSEIRYQERRDENMVQQLDALAKEAKGPIVVRLGVFHTGIIDLLPQNLKDMVKIAYSDEPFVQQSSSFYKNSAIRMQAKIFLKLRNGEQVSDSEWDNYLLRLIIEKIIEAKAKRKD